MGIESLTQGFESNGHVVEKVSREQVLGQLKVPKPLTPWPFGFAKLIHNNTLGLGPRAWSIQSFGCLGALHLFIASSRRNL